MGVLEENVALFLTPQLGIFRLPSCPNGLLCCKSQLQETRTSPAQTPEHCKKPMKMMQAATPVLLLSLTMQSIPRKIDTSSWHHQEDEKRHEAEQIMGPAKLVDAGEPSEVMVTVTQLFDRSDICLKTQRLSTGRNLCFKCHGRNLYRVHCRVPSFRLCKLMHTKLADDSAQNCGTIMSGP